MGNIGKVSLDTRAEAQESLIVFARLCKQLMDEDARIGSPLLERIRSMR